MTSDQLCAYDWRHGKLSPGQQFAANADGLDQFAAYLESRSTVPAYLLTDLIEEDFQRQLLPHVGGKAGRELITRRLTQLYRDTPFRMASILGRDTAGRRDNQVLFNALTNPSLLQPWLEALEYLKIPLAGLYSSSLLGAALVGRLKLRQEHLLLITQQSGGLRQSYFEQGKLRFSRLTPAIDRDGLSVNVATETEKTRQFLTSTRLLERGDVLHTAILAPGPHIAALQALCRDGVELAYQFIDMAVASKRLGLHNAPLLADPLLLSLLGKKQPASHYPLGPRARFYQLWRARLGLYASTALAATVGVLWLAWNIWSIVLVSNDGSRLQAEAASYDQRYQAIMSSLPPVLAKAGDMKSAVSLERLISSQAPGPQAMLVMVSQALEQSPAINLIQLHWQAELPFLKVKGEALPLALAGMPLGPPQSLRLEAEVNLPQNDYRSALGNINQFTQQLARLPAMRVEIVDMPLDLRPAATLSGKTAATADHRQARFILKLVWRP
ncbi:hypothetical protein [Janthinobacterium agaricidamnosum]|uniref:hypothetical protein n=1 Tax=Janthinobacterium agaricidamnosum TaxID=55508 RepID=UPI001F56EF21|nr:hypothetical protein [Janthinobacterium agaricidamnosum]